MPDLDLGLDLIDEWIPELQALFAVITQELQFNPSAVSIREQRAREQADRTIKALSERFTEKGFFPDDDEWVVFALLPQLPEWPEDVPLWVINEQREVIASWVKGSRPGAANKHLVTLMRMNNGDYRAPGQVAQSADDPEAFFQLILHLLPKGLRLTGKHFSNTAEEIVFLREQIAALVRANRAQVFDALLADVAEIKNGSSDLVPNPFLPFGQRQPAHRSSALNMLLALNPEISPARFEALLEANPLSSEQSRAFVESGVLPEPFVDALKASVAEWSRDKALDGIFHSRSYSPDADLLAQKFGAVLLKERFDYELIITEPGHIAYEPSGPDDTAIVLQHDGYGNYGLRDLHNGGTNGFGGIGINGGTDSFYRAIGLALQPHERLSVGMQSDADVAGLRSTLGSHAAAASGGWFDPQNAIEVQEKLLPGWMKNASAADKLLWNQASEDYRQALAEAQTPELPDIKQYGSLEALRNYARAEIKQRLQADVGVTASPDDITVVTTESTWTGNTEPPPDLEFGGGSTGEGEWEHVETRRSLTRLCLDNLRLEDSAFWLTAQFLDSNNRRITALSRHYVHGLVRELNVGDSYVKFLRQRLLTSEYGQWSRDCYTKVMATQMRLDAVEAKMAGDFSQDRLERGYHWVRAVVDHPLDDGNRPLVEGHRIRVQTLTLKLIHPMGRSWDVPLAGVLVIAPESRQSIPGEAVIYTPSAPDSRRFRVFATDEEIVRDLLGDIHLREYLVSRAPADLKENVRKGLGNSATGWWVTVTTQPALTSDLYVTHYHADVERVIAQVDAKTTSTSEANWSSAWNIASTLGELALEFAPFKVALPIAAARSLYALTRGGRAVVNGDDTAVVHFTQAVLLLTDGLPGVKRSKVKTQVAPNIEPGYALRKAPDGLTPRTDGRFNGVYEKIDADGRSSYYAQDAGRTFAIRYDSSDGVWKVINGRNPRSYYQMPVRFNEQGRWNHAPAGRGGGKGEKKAIKAAKAAEAAKARGEPEPSAPAAGGVGAGNRLALDMDGFFESKKFLDAQAGFTDGDLKKSVDRAVDAYTSRGKGHLHLSEAGLFSLDLLGLGGGKRGKWRLMFSPPDKGVLKVHSIMDPH